MAFNEFFPGELFDTLNAVIASHSDLGTFTGETKTDKSGAYHAVFSRTNDHGDVVTFTAYVGYTKAKLKTFRAVGVYH